MPWRPVRPLIALAALAAATAGATSSGATFTSTTANPGTLLEAAPDWVAPTVALSDPGTPLRGTVTLTATASDATTGVASVRIQRSAAGANAWTDVCVDTTAPYSCAWATASAGDGRHDLRAIATDLAGNTATSAVVADRLVDTTAPTAALTDPGNAIRGTVTLTTTSTDAGSGIASVRYERAASGSTSWTTICTTAAAPHSCAFTTTSLPNGDYDLRITVTDAAGNAATDLVEAVGVDNTAPAVTMTNPGATLSGVVTLSATASDADSGVDRVIIQRSPAGAGTWTTICTATTTPFGCRFDTTTVADGLYDLRAIATDVAGNTTTSAVVTNRRVDNTVSTVSMDDPGQYLRGTVTLTATANSSAGIASVRIQRAPTGRTTWTDVCTDTTAPYSCPLDTTNGATPDGGYDLRAIMTTSAGATLTSATVTNRIVDNTAVRAHDVDSLNRTGGTVGRVENGDTLILTFTDQMQPLTLVPGWTGLAPATVYVRLRDGALAGGTSTSDVLQLTADAAGLVPTGLGTVGLRTDSIKTNRTATFTAAATLSTVTVEGRSASRVTIVLGAVSGGGITKRNTATAMTWSPTSSAQDLAGNASSTAPATESGALDANF